MRHTIVLGKDCGHWVNGAGDYMLCSSTLGRFFTIPAKVTSIWAIASDSPVAGALAIECMELGCLMIDGKRTEIDLHASACAWLNHHFGFKEWLKFWFWIEYSP